MKAFCLFFVFIVQGGLAQTIPVFQVLYAEKASLSNGTILKSLDPLLDETIHVADSGYLVLIHETGIPVEFSGDTIFSIRDIHTILDPPISETMKKKIRKTKDSPIRHRYQKSVGLVYLFLSNGPEARKMILSRAGAVLDGGPPNNGVKYPPLIDHKLYFDGDMKIILWRGFEAEGVTAKITDIFDEELKSISLKDNEILLSKNELIQMVNKEKHKHVFIYLEDAQERQLPRGAAFVTQFFTEKYKFPYSKEITTPAAALMAGYFLETYAHYEESKDALPYYELATQLSDKQFYKDMLSNYLKRTGQ